MVQRLLVVDLVGWFIKKKFRYRPALASLAPSKSNPRRQSYASHQLMKRLDSQQDRELGCS